MIGSERDVVQSAGPSSSRLADATVLNIPGGKSRLSEIGGNSFCFRKAEARSPETAVNHNHYRMGVVAIW
jgi:hypothetical protein